MTCQGLPPDPTDIEMSRINEPHSETSSGDVTITCGSMGLIGPEILTDASSARCGNNVLHPEIPIPHSADIFPGINIIFSFGDKYDEEVRDNVTRLESFQ